MEGDARVPSSRREEAGRAAHGPRALRVLTLSAWSSFFSKDVTFAIAAMYMLREPLPRSFPLRRAHRFRSRGVRVSRRRTRRLERGGARAGLRNSHGSCVGTGTAGGEQK